MYTYQTYHMSHIFIMTSFNHFSGISFLNVSKLNVWNTSRPCDLLTNFRASSLSFTSHSKWFMKLMILCKEFTSYSGIQLLIRPPCGVYHTVTYIARMRITSTLNIYSVCFLRNVYS